MFVAAAAVVAGFNALMFSLIATVSRIETELDYLDALDAA